MKGNLIEQQIGLSFLTRTGIQKNYGIITEYLMHQSLIKIFWFDNSKFLWYDLEKLDSKNGNLRTISESRRFD